MDVVEELLCMDEFLVVCGGVCVDVYVCMYVCMYVCSRKCCESAYLCVSCVGIHVM